MQSHDIRSRFLEFFRKRGHAIIPSASLVTTDEKGITNATLFNTAGMQPLVPYLLGKTHPLGNRLANSQKCVRTVDIDDVGDKTHATFFEMLGNWSLGDYFKKEALNWSYEFLTLKEEGLGLDPERLYVTVFEGDSNAPKDDEAANIWSDIFTAANISGAKSDTNSGQAGRIFYLPADKNWWQAGDNGPCGPDSEMYYDINNTFGGQLITREQFIQADEKREVVEVWNDVFMQYEKKDGKIVGKLSKPSVDTGAGLERLSMTIEGVDNIYDTDLFKPAMDLVRGLSAKWYLRSARIIVDHIKAAVFLIADGVVPSNTDRGYVLRKLIRRAVRHTDIIQMSGNLNQVAAAIQNIYKDTYPNIIAESSGSSIQETIQKEEKKFEETLRLGLKEFDRLVTSLSKSAEASKIISGQDAFSLFSSYGFPLELTIEMAKEKGISVDSKAFDEQFKKHQDVSRAGAEQKFKGGLADQNEMTVRYHTATHLLHQALHDVLGEGVMQKGSNINTERLRFDFSCGSKMTDEQKKRVEDIINEKIKAALPVKQVTLSKAEAEKTKAKHFFGEKYGDEISIYFVGNNLDQAYSAEFCGGPHVKNTSELAGPEGKWSFKIAKEEAVAQGIRRIKAVLS